MRYKVIRIDWDCFAPPENYNLPLNAEIEADCEENVIDELSEVYGWAVNSVEEIIPIADREPQHLAEMTDELNFIQCETDV